VTVRPRIVCVGLAVVDLVAHVDAPLVTGVKQFASELTTVFGGPATTAAVTAARLGADVTLIAPVGDDERAEALRRALLRSGVEVGRLVVRSDAPTSTSLVVVSRDGERTIVNVSSPLLLAAPSAEESAAIAEAALAADAVLVDVRWPGAARIALDSARAAGVPAVLDLDRTTAEQREGIRALIGRATHVVGSYDAVTDVLGPTAGGSGRPPDGSDASDVPAGLAALATLAGDGFVGVTRGEQGMWWRAGTTSGHVPAFEVDVVETLGAGDVWHGAFIAGLAHGLDALEAATDATAAAALRCTRRGGWDTLPDRQDIDRLRATARTRSIG
jgi:sulfofructose kinase